MSRKTKIKEMKKRGSALITSTLLLAVISTASFAIARLALIETRSGEIAAGNIKAYYLAEGGIEEGLLRWRYNHNVSLFGSTKENKMIGKTELSASGAVRSKVSEANWNNSLNENDQIGLAIYNLVDQASLGNQSPEDLFNRFKVSSESAADQEFYQEYNASRPDLYVTKDNKLSFVIPPGQAQDIDLILRFHRLSTWGSNLASASADSTWATVSENLKIGVEIKLYRYQDNGQPELMKEAVFSPSNHLIDGAKSDGCESAACRLSVKSVFTSYAISDKTLITIKPLNANIIVGAYGVNQEDQTKKSFVDSVTHIESIGTANGRTRGLKTEISRSSGQVLGLYDYLLFQGN
jgi:hypothetical protein